jgi:hypothetical protein
MSTVASCDPSSARMISASTARARKYSAQRVRVDSMRRPSLKAGRIRLRIAG